MEKTDNMPWWVFLAFSSIATRKAALWLIGSCLVFTLYCVPWSQYLAGSDWVARIFLIDDWSWFATMVPLTLWYWLALRWVDRHTGWATVAGTRGG